jgi:hypothetical protein
MMDEKLETRLNEELDGVLSPEDESSLREALGRDPEARAYREDLGRLETLIAEAGWEEPPAELKANVVRAVRELPVPGTAGRRRNVPARASWTEAVAAFFRTPGYSRVVLGFGAGIAVGLIVFALSSPSVAPDRNSLTGTMIHPSPNSSSITIATRSFSVGPATGTLITRVSAGESFVTATLEGGAARIEITPEAGVSPLGVDRSPGSDGLVSLERDRVVIDAEAPGWTTVRLGPARPGMPDRVRVRVSADGESAEEVLPLAGAEN